MYFEHTALAAACIIMLVKGEEANKGSQENGEENNSEEMSDPTVDGNHTFVALIDIVFVDDSKRTCTGAIVHENVVVTAAHCFFEKDKVATAKPELTASFVVIGTKKMFDTGYEQYLPIERIVVHPKYEGWTADLALVFTFAGMTSDKPGTVIPLASEKSAAHLDSNVTVFSWGHARSNGDPSMEKPAQKKFDKYKKNVDAHASDESCSSDVDNKKHKGMALKRTTTKRNTAPMAGKRFRNEHDDNDDDDDDDEDSSSSQRVKKKKTTPKYKQNKNKNRQERAHDENSRREIFKGSKKRISIGSRYLTALESTESLDFSINPYVFGNSSYESIEQQLKTHPHRASTNPAESTYTSTEQMYQEDGSEEQSSEKENNKKSKSRVLFGFIPKKSWRRSMGASQNRLLVENFGFVNLHICRTLVDKALPAKYNISKHNDVICYSNSERCVDDNDSGAPAVRQGQLIAITVGGAECEGDHVTVGMKISCYCSWISDNLPAGSKPLECCKKCCDVNHKEEISKKERRHRFRNRFI